MKRVFVRLWVYAPVGILVAIVASCIYALGVTKPVQAATVTPGICRASIVFDRSSSVTEANLRVLRAQTQRLFQVGGLYDAKIEVAFWSFSNTVVWNNTVNYNTPFHDFVSSRGENASFNTGLAQIQSSGRTNYEQGLAYNQGNRNPFLGDIINKTDIIVFLSDGQPNEATDRMRAAAQAHQAAGRTIVGGLIGTQPNEMSYTINGSRTDRTNIFSISSNYSDLSVKLKEVIGEKCNERNPPVPPCEYNASIPATDPNCKPPTPQPYSLIPSVSATSAVVSGSDSVGFEYRVVNDSAQVASDQTQWSVKRLVVERNQPVDALQFNGAAYRDGYSCAQLVGLMNGKATCVDSGASGTKIFPRGTTTMSVAELGPVGVTAIDDSWQVGTKLCYVFTIDRPTEKSSPVDRYSKAACVVVGKRPTFQVHGGDVSVGRYFEGDERSDVASNVRGSVTAKFGSINKTFGSWVEYGIFAPGVVSGVASASGLEGGYDGSVASNQSLWSKLTFANTGEEMGHYTNVTGMGKATTMADYFIQGREVVKDLVSENTISFRGDDVVNGLYTKTNGNITLEASVLEKGKMVILNVPDGVVTINGNLSYAGGTYSSVGEIPQLIIVAKNIVINDTVTSIDAWLLAQDGEKKGGTITTCQHTPPLTSEMCNSPLRVNGPVVAKDLQLRRTGGAGVGQASGDAAETFNLRADTYLWGYNEGRSALRAETTYTTELPPQF